MSAPSAIATGVEREFLVEPSHWEALLEYERAACTEPGYLDAGTHLLAAARRDPVAA
jgi:hypothetical protein